LHVVANITTERHAGLFNPFTASGTIVVDGVVASVQSKWFADAAMDRLGLTHAIPALYQARPPLSLDFLGQLHAYVTAACTTRGCELWPSHITKT
jgi:hypothetical protein